MKEQEWYDQYWLEALDRICTIQTMFDVLLIEEDDDENEIWHPAISKAELVEEMDEIRIRLANVYQKMGEAMGMSDGEVH